MIGLRIGAIFFYFISQSSHIFATTYSIREKLNNFIVDTQYIDETSDRKNGTWPIEVRGRENTSLIFLEADIFFPLQTSLSLLRTQQFYPVKNLSNINAHLYRQTQNYFQDTFFSSRTFGSIAFWPLMEIEPQKFIHNFGSDKKILESFDNLNILNDIDTSSRYFLWLSNQNRSHPFIDAFLTTSSNNIDQNNGAYKTWIHNKNKKNLPNNTDCVVNLNVVSALKSYERLANIQLPKKNKIANESACLAINRMLNQKNLLSCSHYYDRLTELILAYALAYKEAPKCLNDSLAIMQKALLEEAIRVINDKNSQTDELSEIIISLAHLPPSKAMSLEHHYAMSEILREQLKVKLIQDEEAAYAKASSAFIGAFSKETFDWYSKAYSSALALEALSTPQN
ncbi:MAG: hypothetical protein KC505_03205 [Myxococcales bacterium]|nr:hypothetical protein [Myxococcales bacterium]USN50096.1 MAG: hypothetical protein H6731_07435 [Myxococcales bacterium]